MFHPDETASSLSPLRALQLIHDDHGYIRAGQCFLPGWRHNCAPGKDPEPVAPFSGDTDFIARDLLSRFKACEVYRN